MVDEMAKSKHRNGNWKQKRLGSSRSRRCRGDIVGESTRAVIKNICPNGQWKTTFLRRYRSEDEKLCEEAGGRCGHTRRRRLRDCAPKPAPKRKKIRMARTVNKSKGFAPYSCPLCGPTHG